MATYKNDMRFRPAPPRYRYFTFSIDVAATLELYCDGGDEVMLQKLSDLQDHKYAGYCSDSSTSGQCNKDSRSLILGNQTMRGLICAFLSFRKRPILGQGRHLVSKPLPWDHCYHPTCYDLWARVPFEGRNYDDSPLVTISPAFLIAFREDVRYGELLRARLDDTQIQRILDGQEDAPDTDDASETDGRTCKTFLAKVPESDDPEEDGIFVPVMRIDHVLSNVPEISDPSQLCGDVDLFREIVQEYQFARYGSVLFDPLHGPEADDTSVPDNASWTYSITSEVDCSSLAEELSGAHMTWTRSERSLLRCRSLFGKENGGPSRSSDSDIEAILGGKHRIRHAM
ncbi:uncharacterized protein EV420DRAFT_1745247 [Desarmillaria tabescens]|uniref:Uncharacterized protein n=1 Tax=Armillaria tabescens TaxID=1929756 RepID=A0AA39NDM3_ARMTA|nr:uncharacterized protein EV420DRAFT_1745247 [Desarmillaria tabescens]KAK0463717.1 hypothetical protein EV420DRAFT_1745247 [Desarmillaria tabescens]